MPRKKTSAPKPSELSFEQAMTDLEEIVARMEEEELPLEELVANYELGTKLLDRCEEVLGTAKKKLMTIAAPKSGASMNESAGDESGEPDDQDQDDDIRLF